MSTDLTVEKWDMEVAERSASLQIKLAEAHVGLVSKWLDVAKKKIEVEKDRQQLLRIKDAQKDYIRARQKALAKARKLNKEKEMISRKAKDLALLSLGETIRAGAPLTMAWAAFRFFINRVEIDFLLVDVDDKAASNFVRPRFPEQEIKPRPRSQSAIALFDWCRINSYMPVVGSSAYNKLRDVIRIMKAEFAKKLLETENALQVAEEEAQKIRQGLWKTELGISL